MSVLTALAAQLSVFVQWFLHKWDAMIHSGLPLFFWVRPRWSIKQIPDQSGKVILVTGANSGTGFISAYSLYEAGAKVYVACRSEKKAQGAIQYIKENRVRQEGQTGELVFLHMDLSDLNSVKRAVEEFTSKEDQLDVLMCNAGIMATQEGQYTSQDYTLQFGTNVLGHQALIHHLLPVLLSTSRSKGPPRVVLLSSAGHSAAPTGGIDYKSIVRDYDTNPANGAVPRRGKHEYRKWAEYGQSKWGDIALARYLDAVYGPRGHLSSRRIGDGEILSFSAHPGLVATNLAVHLGGTLIVIKYLPFLIPLVVRWPDVGAGNQLWLATVPQNEARTLSGEYIVPFQRVGRPRPDVLDEAVVVRLWDWCEEQVKRHS